MHWGSDSDPAAVPGTPSKLLYPDSRTPVSGGFCVRTYAIHMGKMWTASGRSSVSFDIRLRDPQFFRCLLRTLFSVQIDIFVEGCQQSLAAALADRHRILPLNQADRFFLDPARLFRRLDRILLLLSLSVRQTKDSSGHFSQSGRPPGMQTSAPSSIHA